MLLQSISNLVLGFEQLSQKFDEFPFCFQKIFRNIQDSHNS